jgi:hypothetical protein
MPLRPHRVVEAYASNEPQVLSVLSSDEDYIVRSYVAANPNTPVEALQALSRDKGQPVVTRAGANGCDVRYNVAKNPSTPAATLNEMSSDEDYIVRCGVASNPNTPADVLRALSGDIIIVRWNVAGNPGTPVEVLLDLIKDTPEIAAQAVMNIQHPERWVTRSVHESGALPTMLFPFPPQGRPRALDILSGRFMKWHSGPSSVGSTPSQVQSLDECDIINLMEKKIKFVAGAHSTVTFQRKFLMPLFNAGIITEYPGATEYSICYGELCAYRGKQLLATWSAEVPDGFEPAEEASTTLDDYVGKWNVYLARLWLPYTPRTPR